MRCAIWLVHFIQEYHQRVAVRKTKQKTYISTLVRLCLCYLLHICELWIEKQMTRKCKRCNDTTTQRHKQQQYWRCWRCCRCSDMAYFLFFFLQLWRWIIILQDECVMAVGTGSFNIYIFTDWMYGIRYIHNVMEAYKIQWIIIFYISDGVMFYNLYSTYQIIYTRRNRTMAYSC